MQVVIIHEGQVLRYAHPSLVLVEDDSGTPVAVAAAGYGGENSFVVSSIDDDARFHDVLKRLGLYKTTFVDKIEESDLDRSLTPRVQ